jgi:molybdopterin-containing oxidoreductase family membrane subunit
MSQNPQGVLAVFENPDAVVDAVKALQAKGRKKFTVMTPVPSAAIAEAIDQTPSPVRLCTFVGGLIGGILGFTLCAWTSLDWPLLTNGKEILSVPPFMIIMFECTVLIGGLTNLVAMLFFSGLPDLQMGEAFDARFVEDRFGIWVPCGQKDSEDVAATLRGAGAEEVRVDAA